MKVILLCALAAFASIAAANGAPPSPPPAAGYGGSASASVAVDARAQSSSLSDSASSATSGASSASTGSVYGGDSRMYILPAPVGGSNLPAGMCQRSSYSHFAVGWNLVSVANGQSHTDMECLELLVRLEALRRSPASAPHTPSAPVAAPVAPPPKVCWPKPRKPACAPQ